MQVDSGDVKAIRAEWQCTFPFVAEFEQVVEKEVQVEYLKQLGCVLEPVVGVCSAVIDKGEVSKETVSCLFFSVIALARLRVALAYEAELLDDGVDKVSLLSALREDYEAMKERECLVDVPCNSAIDTVIGDSVRSVWVFFSTQAMYTARHFVDTYPAFVADVKVTLVAQVLVVGEQGQRLCDVIEEHGDKPILPVAVYRALWLRLKGVDLDVVGQEAPDFFLAGRAARLDIGYGWLETEVVASWLWLLLSSLAGVQGYCYQLLYAPVHRFQACLLLRQQPTVHELLWHLSVVKYQWACKPARIKYGAVLHVEQAGFPDLDVLRTYSEHHIGMDLAASSSVDYYARALVDEFIEKHKPLPVAPLAVPPLDTEFDKLSVSTESGAGREFVDVANLLYGAVDENVSPRAELADVARFNLQDVDDALVERDSDIVQQIYNRLADGAVIHESYFERTYRRFRRFHRRPRLDRSDGRMYHVFEGFPAEGGAGLGPWELDKNWGIPGWQSYVATFEPGDARTVSFSVTGGCQDVRMDCTGDGAIELGDCKVHVDGTLLWFTNSIRLRIVAKSVITLRISVPDALGAMAMGPEMRRYMYIPGYTVVARSYDVITGTADFSIVMERVKRNSIAGCHVYSGQRYIERGRHRFKLSQVASLAPARILFKTDPPHALEFVSVCGMRLRPRSRDHVSALVDLHNVEMYASLSMGANFCISLVQVVRTKEFELTVLSTREAKAARARLHSVSG